MRKIFVLSSIVISALILLWAYFWIDALFAFVIVAPLLIAIKQRFGLARLIATTNHLPEIGSKVHFGSEMPVPA